MYFFDIRELTDGTPLQIEAADAPVKDLSQESIGQIQFQSCRIGLLVIHERFIRCTGFPVRVLFFFLLQYLHVIHDSPVDTAPAQDGMGIGRIRRRIMKSDLRFFPQGRHVIAISRRMLPRFFQGHIDAMRVRRLAGTGEDADAQGQGHEGRDKSYLFTHFSPSSVSYSHTSGSRLYSASGFPSCSAWPVWLPGPTGYS